MNNIKLLHGIDSLYYFAESNENYDDLFIEILDQIEELKGSFQKKDIEFENNDINITINDIPLNYLGKAEGFYWFKDINEFFKIGFKDKYKNRGLNDIRVQLQGVGIYTIGIKSLIDFINNMLLKHYVTGYYPITRADLNCFIQYDFSFISKDMFVTRKRQYSTINEIGSSTRTQTLYIGKEPFKLRIYDKKEELKKSKKKDLMHEYFMNNGFDMDNDVFNIEFEIHRTYLKSFNISTIEELLGNAVNLFKDSMNQIRLVDISNITDNDIKNNSKSRANTLPIWEHIQESYKLDDFLQIQLPLIKVKRAVSIYDDYKFKTEYISLIRRAFINNLNIDTDYLELLFYKAKESLKRTTTNKEIKKRYIDVEVIEENSKTNSSTKENLRLLEDSSLIKPVEVISVSTLSDYDLQVYYEKAMTRQHLGKREFDIYLVAQKELIKRGLIPVLSVSDCLEKEDKKL